MEISLQTLENSVHVSERCVAAPNGEVVWIKESSNPKGSFIVYVQSRNQAHQQELSRVPSDTHPKNFSTFSEAEQLFQTLCAERGVTLEL